MTKLIKVQDFTEAPKLSLSEQVAIEQKIEFETSKSFHSMVKLGAFCNILGGFFYVISIYNPNKPTSILYWYIALVLANLLNVLWALRFEYNNISRQEILKCRRGFVFIVMFICLTWGSISIMFMSEGTQQQMTTIIFLSAVLICFSFSTASDLTIGIVSIVCLIAPTVFYSLYLMIQVYSVSGQINSMDLSICTAFFMLGLFMLAACFFGNMVIRKIFRLGYENVLLRQKLEGMNALLEKRVKERTKELETSLTLVTYQSTHDLLTELPNERLLHEHIEAVTERAVKNHYQFAVACFSLNGMVKIHDGIGHQAANTVIQRVAQRFSEVYGENKKYFISLLRQDIFIILIEPVVDVHELENLAEGLFVVLDKPFYVAKESLKLKGSVGVSVFPVDGRNLDTLITNAEAARVLASKRGGNSVRIYNEVINANASRQLNIENLLYHAVDNNELILNYQPFVNYKTGMICGVEALVRWKSPILGLVAPLDFIPIAEANGMIMPIGEWVLRTACEQLKSWQEKGFNTFKVSINLSAKQLEQNNIIERIAIITDNLGLDPKYLELELTETEIFQSDAIPMINQLSEMGVALAIDDFGTGHSEFSTLKLFKVDKIKIDKTFIQDIDASIDSRNIVCNTIALAKRMNIQCIAEGVETVEQVKYLNKNGCHLMQGYYFSRPLSADAFMELLLEYQGHSKQRSGNK